MISPARYIVAYILHPSLFLDQTALHLKLPRQRFMLSLAVSCVANDAFIFFIIDL